MCYLCTLFCKKTYVMDFNAVKWKVKIDGYALIIGFCSTRIPEFSLSVGAVDVLTGHGFEGITAEGERV